MAVRHGYGKVVTDGLVFAYDTGDTRNSFKGRPTTNIAPYISTHGTSDFALPSLPEGVFTVHSKGAILNGTTNWADIFNTSGYSIPNGERLVVSAWVYIPADKVNNRFNINADINGSNTSLASWHDLEAGKWHKLRGSWLNSTGATANATYTRVEPWTPAEWTGGSITTYGINFMVESGPFSASYMGSQALPANTTRSNTEGLIDLTGTRSLNLSTVSFNSDANIIFDGTDDMIELSDNPQNGATEATWEFVTKFDLVHDNETSTYRQLYTQESSVWIGQYYDYIGLDIKKDNNAWFDGNGGRNTNSQMGPVNSGQYYHVVITWDGTNAKGYLNGELNYTTAIPGLTSLRNGSAPRRIGRRSGNPLVGEMPITKLYTKALTANEVAQNFNHYKTRFSI